MIALSQRLSITPFTGVHHYEKIIKQVEWLNDPEVTKFSEQRHRFHTTTTQVDYINSFHLPSSLCEIVIDAGQRMIGTMSVHIDSPNKVADIGIMIGDKTQWGKGYGAEAWCAVGRGLLMKGIRKIEGGCMASNTAMLKIFTKFGMTLEGRRVGHCLVEDRPIDWVFYGRFRDETI